MTRFYWWLTLSVAGLCAGYAALVLYSASWPEAAALRTFYDWQPRASTAGEFGALRAGLAGLAGAALGLAGVLGRGGPGRAELGALGRELAGVGRRLGGGWRTLRPGQRCLAGGLLLALTALRFYYSCTLQAYDDAISYELFVRERLLAVSSAYPLPNNHVFANTLAWVFYQVYPGFWWSMRLPVLGAATGATALWFLALRRVSSFRVALLAVGLFSVPLESLYYAATGRGYWLLVGLGAVGFLALLALSEGQPDEPDQPDRRRAAALALVLSGVLGLYTVPTHLLFLGPAYGWWGLRAAQRRDGRALAQLAALAGLTLLATGLLYAPLLLLAGPRLLLHHRYIAPLAPAQFGASVLANLRQPYQLLVWTPLTLLALASLGGLVRRARTGQLPPAPARWVRQLGLPSAWLLLLPYALAAAQRSYPPERTLFYKAQYTFILLALAADWVLRRAGGCWQRPARAALLGAALAFTALQLWRVDQQETRWRLAFGRQLARPGVEWLSRQPPGPVLAPVPVHRFLLRRYGRPGFETPPWQLDAQPRPGVRYRYLVVKAGERPAYAGRVLAGAPAGRGHVFDIFVVPPPGLVGR